MPKRRVRSFKNAVILPNVKLGDNCVVEEFCVIGKREAGEKDDKLIIGDKALIRSHTVIYSNNVIGHNFKTGNGAVIRQHNLLGDNVIIGNHSIIEGECWIGNNVTVHSNCYLGEKTVVMDGVWIGPGCTTFLTQHPRCRYKDVCNQGPTIEKEAIIGGGTILMPRVKIGEGAMIASGSVVTKDIPAGMVAAGIPAIVTKKVEEIECPFGKKYERLPV
ncbi:MAG: DapH/DapD/GlmU-related protein [bacterium]